MKSDEEFTFLSLKTFYREHYEISDLQLKHSISVSMSWSPDAVRDDGVFLQHAE